MLNYLLFGFTVLLNLLVSCNFAATATTTGDKVFVNFGACNCDPSWVCTDGRQTVTHGDHQLSFERPFELRGKRTRLCNNVPEAWRSFVHFSAQNKYCITELGNGTYFYEVVMGDCRFNTYNMLTLNGNVTLTHYQNNLRPRLFTGMITISTGKLCMWDPRQPLANHRSILEIVDGCGYPQPTRVSLVKIVQVTDTDASKNKTKPDVAFPGGDGTTNTTTNTTTPTVKCGTSSCANGTCSVSNNKTVCKCNTGWSGDKCETQCSASGTNKCLNGKCTAAKSGTFTIKTCKCTTGWYGTLCNVQCNAAHPCVHGTCAASTNGTTKQCKCDLGWSGTLCNTATAVIVREEKVWVKLGGKKVCLTLRKEGKEWGYYIQNRHTGQMQEFQPPPGFKWQVYLEGETIIIQAKTKCAKKSEKHNHLISIKLGGRSCQLLLKLEKGKWVPYIKSASGAWVCFHPPPGFSLTVKIGNDIIRIKPEPTYHKIQIVDHGHKRTLYMMRVNHQWAPFYKDHGALRSYHAPSDHHVIVRIGDENVHIQHKKPCTHFPCKNGGQCTDDGVTFHCACGARWSGATCQDSRKDSLCKPETCGEHGMCVELQHGLVQCHCKRGWSGFKCSVPTTCPPLACSNGGVMVTIGHDRHCQCPVGFRGRCCQKRVSECSRDPCNKHGLCEQIGSNYACHCRAPYTGRHCQSVRRMRFCQLNGQTYRVGQVLQQHCNRCVCVANGHLVCTHRSCHAAHFVAPRIIKHELYEGHLCGAHPCVQGHCNSVHFQPRCRCYHGYTGPTCETQLVIHQVAPVHQPVRIHSEVQIRREISLHHRPVHRRHLVTVSDRPTVYHHSRSPCDRVQCGYGSCNVVRHMPHCTCREGWRGARCDTRIEMVDSPCAKHSCLHAGSCIVRQQRPYCLCAARFSGHHCQRDVGYNWYSGLH